MKMPPITASTRYRFLMISPSWNRLAVAARRTDRRAFSPLCGHLPFAAGALDGHVGPSSGFYRRDALDQVPGVGDGFAIERGDEIARPQPCLVRGPTA